MVMRLSLEIAANGDVAVRTVENLGKAVKKTGADTQDMGRKGAAAGAQTNEFGASAKAGAASVNTLSVAQTRNAATATAMGAANRGAAGSMGNLIAQFNDIGVMMAAGQNPLQLALQQGTQISQVIGPMGAAGAVRSLGGAFLGMLNPISLVTIGTIAGGAALTQWAVSALGAGEETKTLTENVDDLEAATSRYQEASEIAAMSTAELEERFGGASGSIRTTLNLLQELAATDAQRAIDGVASGIADLLDISGSGDQRGGIADFFDVNIGLAFTDAQRTARAEARQLTAEFANQQSALQSANGDLDKQIAAMEQMVGTAKQLAAATDGRSESEDALLANLANALLAMQQQRGATVDAAQQGRVAYEQYYASRIAGENNVAALQARELADRQSILQVYAATRLESDAATASAQTMLDDLEAQNALQQTILEHGADSFEVAELRAASERQVFEEMLATSDVAQDLKDRLYAAFLVSQDIATADLGGGIRAAAADAATLAQNLRLAKTFSGEDAAFNVPVIPGANENDANDRAVANLTRLTTPKRSRGGSGRSTAESEAKKAARELERQREGVTDLIAGLNDEIAILRESDPVQKEMLRNRETLKAATEEERVTIVDLITQRDAETAALERQSEQYDFVRSAGQSAFDALRSSGGDLESFFGSIADSIADIAFQALLLGEGPLGNGNSGILGTLAGAAVSAFNPSNVNAAPLSAIQARAEGGMIFGPGSGTSDDVLARLSNGEFVATAKATSKYRPFLEAMNAGTFATGGAVDGSSATGTFGGVSFSPKFAITNNGSTPIQGGVREEDDGNGGRQYSLVLADAVGGALEKSGGGAKRTLRNTYGVNKRGTRR